MTFLRHSIAGTIRSHKEEVWFVAKHHDALSVELSLKHDYSGNHVNIIDSRSDVDVKQQNTNKNELMP